MKSMLSRVMTVAAVIGLVAAAPLARAADPIKIVALYNLSAGGLASIDGPSLNGALARTGLLQLVFCLLLGAGILLS